jgi:hypothetical protein
MTAPRACRACGAPLPADVRWCLRCYEPVREFAPRDRQLPPLERVQEPPPWVGASPLRDPDVLPPTYSRWRAGPTTFGPVGRLIVTILVALIFPWDAIVTLNPLRLWFMLGYTIFAAYVLRHTWRRERVMVERPAGRPTRRAGLNAHARFLSRPVDARIVLGCVLVAAVVAVAYAWVDLDAYGRYSVLVAVLVGVGAIVWSWWTET